ncbi:outer membrane protein TolC [Mucilaginibacter frigoritolerans]|uniref:Outer membrane protein TolC n=1 Tax=Mucilaginibacter frigoritolerans TaxID=652788 RepID=A0A562U6Q9_9SPHI|nr:TolC family protein [Mucilaginibacter frigoritolerans]TWJ00851.1 outer membrane protein TolC [Mucilaginibacter frigoritolerans]
MAKIYYNKSAIRASLLITCLFCLPFISYSQTKTATNAGSKSIAPPLVVPDTTKNSLLLPVVIKDTGKVQYFTLKQCIDYALQHQPGLNIALINVDVAKTTNAISLSGWLPQVNASGDLIHNIQTNGSTTTTNNGSGSTTTTTNKTGYTNSFVPGVAVTQTIFNPSLLYAYKSAPLYVKQAQQVTDSTKIFLVSSVSKSFYTLLNTLEQINVFKEDTARLGKSLRDAYHQYKGGIVDETDYEQADITLNNSKAQLKQANENVVPQYATLKKLLGYPVDKQFNVVFDTLEMMNSIHIDTTEQLQYEKRIEFQSLKTSKDLQSQLVNYYKFAWLPTLSAFFNYDLTFANNNYNNLLSSSYPNSYVGLSFSLPIFTGFSRVNNVKKARLQQQILDWDETDLKSAINVEYTSALANYKGNYYNLQLLQRNVNLARRVYFVVDLQYKQGIVAYLNVITAESNLMTSEISYLNALFQVLSNKIDLQKAMGNISY